MPRTLSRCHEWPHMARQACLAALALLLPAACTGADDPVLACQKRLVVARGQADAEMADAKGDPFGAARYEKLDRAGCSAAQLDRITRLAAIARSMPALMDANERAARTGDATAHMDAFQRMNDALIELSDLEQAASADFERMLEEARG